MRLLTSHYRSWFGFILVSVCVVLLWSLTGCEQKDSQDINWCLEQAGISAAGISEEELRDKAFIEIVRVRLGLGDFAGAYEVLEQVQDGEKPWLYNEVLKGQAESGDMAGAKDAAENITYASFKGLAWEDIATIEARGGDIEGALATAGLIESEIHRADAYSRIVKVQADGGAFAQAATTVQLIDEPNYFRCLAKSYIVEALTASGDIEEARATAAGIVDAERRGTAWAAIARSQLENGDISGAEQTARSMGESIHKVMVYSDMALSYGRQGETASARRLYSEALKMAMGAGEESEINISRYILKVMLLTGETDRALRLARGIRGRTRQSWFYNDIARALAAQGEIDRAKSVAKFISELNIRDETMSMIVLEEVKRVEIEEGLALAGTLEDLDLQVQVYCALAERQAESGDIEEAKETLKQAQNMAEESMSMVVLARLQINDIKGAWADARRLPDQDRQKKLKAFRMVAAALAVTGDMASIKRWVASHSDAEFITYLYLGAAEGMVNK